MRGEAWPQSCLSLRERRGDGATQTVPGSQSTGHKPPEHFICPPHLARTSTMRSKDHAEPQHTDAHLELFLCRSAWAPTILDNEVYLWSIHEHKHARILVRTRERGEAREVPWAAMINRAGFNWINGCVMCNDTATRAGAFCGGCVANSSFLASLWADALC